MLLIILTNTLKEPKLPNNKYKIKIIIMALKKILNKLILIIFPHLNQKTKHSIKKCLGKLYQLSIITNLTKVYTPNQQHNKISNLQ